MLSNRPQISCDQSATRDLRALQAGLVRQRFSRAGEAQIVMFLIAQ